MAAYIIAGKADSQFLAEVFLFINKQAEALAEAIEQETRNIKVKTLIKYPEDWPEFSRRVTVSLIH